MAKKKKAKFSTDGEALYVDFETSPTHDKIYSLAPGEVIMTKQAVLAESQVEKINKILSSQMASMGQSLEKLANVMGEIKFQAQISEKSAYIDALKGYQIYGAYEDELSSPSAKYAELMKRHVARREPMDTESSLWDE